MRIKAEKTRSVANLTELQAALVDKNCEIIISPPAAAASLGIGYWVTLLEQSGFSQSGKIAILDCANDAGLASAALAAGLKNIALDPLTAALPALKEIAAQYQAKIWAGRRLV
ncbi:MAG: hypothetical protein AB7G80_00165 [Dongiaceae bacterium]